MTWTENTPLTPENLNKMVLGSDSNLRIVHAIVDSATVTFDVNSGFTTVEEPVSDQWTLTLTTPYVAGVVYLALVNSTTSTGWDATIYSASNSAVTFSIAGGTGVYKIHVLAVGI